MGLLKPIKNLANLVTAWRTVRTAFPDAILRIAGSGDEGYTSTLKRLAAQNGDGIEFVGFVTGADKESELEQAALLVLPSLHENFGVVLIEAISKGIPVVVTPEVQLAPFIQSHRLGTVAENGMDTALATAITYALRDSITAKRVREQGPAIVRQYFGERPIGLELARMYQYASNLGQ